MLELKNVSKTFNPGTVNEKKALDGLSVSLADGDFVTIVGSNGAGKSTLFNAVAGDFFVDEGPIRLDGADITYLPAYRRSRQIGRLFQDPMRGTAPHMTIEENLALAYLRTAKHQRAFFSRVSKADKAFFREQLARLDIVGHAVLGHVDRAAGNVDQHMKRGDPIHMHKGRGDHQIFCRPEPRQLPVAEKNFVHR